MTLSYVFVGPSLRREDYEAIPDLIVRPPVKQGDLYRAVLDKPFAIGIIDGYFGGAPSVWHKEIIWALAHGIHVFGSASMGAIRGAELYAFGMRGVGTIFEMFRDGALEDDDEVALLHGPADMGFAPLSEPMVNVRATLKAAEEGNIIEYDCRRKIEALAKSIYFADRTWPLILEKAADLPAAQIIALRAWLPNNSVDQKRIDACALLDAMSQIVLSGAPHEPKFSFQSSLLWDEFVAGFRGASPRQVDESILAELKLQGIKAYMDVKSAALGRFFALREARYLDVDSAAEGHVDRITRFRREKALYRGQDFEKFLHDNHINAVEWNQVLAEIDQTETVTQIHNDQLKPHLMNELRLRDIYRELALRAGDKVRVLGREAESLPAPQGAQRLELREWYFGSILGRPVPDDISDYASKLGFTTLEEFDVELSRERQYLKRKL